MSSETVIPLEGPLTPKSKPSPTLVFFSEGEETFVSGDKFLFLMFVFKNPNRALLGSYEMMMKKTVTRNTGKLSGSLFWEPIVRSGAHTTPFLCALRSLIPL